MFASPPVHWKLSPSIAWEAEEDRSMAFSCSSLVLCVSHCCRNIGEVKSHSYLRVFSALSACYPVTLWPVLSSPYRTSSMSCSKFSPGWFGLEQRVRDTWAGWAGQGMALCRRVLRSHPIPVGRFSRK